MNPRTLAVSTLFCLLISTATLATEESPLMSAELPLTGDVLRSAAGAQSLPAVAGGSSGFFAAWTDRRAGDGINADVYASRIDRDGKSLDPANIPVAPTFTEDTHPAVVWNGSHFVVVYASVYYSLGLTAVEYDAEGTTTRGNPILRRQGPVFPAIAWNGDRYLVAWSETSNDGLIASTRGMFVSASLEPASDPFDIGPGAGRPVVASDGDGFLVVVSGEGRVMARHVSATGAAGPEISLGASSTDAQVVWSGREYLVACVNAGVEVTRLSRDGTLIAPRRLNELTTIAESRVAAVWTGDRLLLAWVDYASGTAAVPRHEVVALTLDDKLEIVGGPLILFAGDGLRSHLALAVDGSVAALVWAEIDGADSAIESMTFDPRNLASSASRPRELVSRSITGQNVVGAAASGDQWGTLWLEAINDSEARLRFGRVTANGQSLDGEGIELGLYDGASIAANESMYMVVAYRLGWLYAIRISREGVVLDREPIRFGPAALLPRIAAGGDRSFFAAWARGSIAPPPAYMRYDTFGAMITGGGQALPEQMLSPPAPTETSYTPGGIVWSGTDYQLLLDRRVTYWCGSRFCPTAHSLYVQRVSAGGTVIGGTVPIVEFENQLGVMGDSQIASSANGSVVLWTNYGPDSQLRAKRLTRSGVQIDDAGSPGLLLAEGTRAPQIVFNGRTFIVAWQDQNAGQPPTRSIATFDFTNGSVSAKVSFPDDYQSNFRLAGSNHGRTLGTYNPVRQLTPEAHPGGIRRAVFRVFGGVRRRAAGR